MHGADEAKGNSFKNGGVLKQTAKLQVYFVVRNVDTTEHIVGHGVGSGRVGSQACRLHFSLQSAPVAAEELTTCHRADEPAGCETRCRERKRDNSEA